MVSLATLERELSYSKGSTNPGVSIVGGAKTRSSREADKDYARAQILSIQVEYPLSLRILKVCLDRM